MKQIGIYRKGKLTYEMTRLKKYKLGESKRKRQHNKNIERICVKAQR